MPTIRLADASRNAHESVDWIALMDRYRKAVRPHHVVLEVGASSAERTLTIAQCCDRVIGVEIQPQRIPTASRNISYVEGDWQRLTESVPKCSIDMVLSSHTIEHVQDDHLALEQTYEVLRPGGKVLITTPNRRRAVRAIIELVTRPRRFPWWEHVREYDWDDIHRLVELSSFGKHKIDPVAFGVHGGPLYAYISHVPRVIKAYASFWLVELSR